MIERYQHFTAAINNINRSLHKLSGEEMERHGLKSSHAIYFIALAEQGDSGLTATQLCERSGRDKADVSRMLTQMMQQDLVVKDSTRRRYNGVFRLTTAGMDIARHLQARAAKAVEAAGKDLTDEARHGFYAALDSIADNLHNMTKKGIPE